jgi:hypothetical protein
MLTAPDGRLSTLRSRSRDPHRRHSNHTPADTRDTTVHSVRKDFRPFGTTLRTTVDRAD